LSAEPHPFRGRRPGGFPRAACPSPPSICLKNAGGGQPRTPVFRVAFVHAAWRCLVVLAGLVLAAPAQTRAEDTATVSSDSAMRSHLTGIDLDGTLWRLGQSPSCRAVTLVFLSIDCPISNAYIPAL